MPIKIFFCYSRRDEALLIKLKAHLRPLQRQGLIDLWHDRDISAGDDWEQAITQQLNEADIILLLISPDFMESDYCYGKEMQRALERHANRECVVIPIILRPVYWHGEPLGKLQALPTDGKPVTGPEWHDQDSAFYDVVIGMNKVIQEITPLVNARKFVLFKTIRDNQKSAALRVAISRDGKLLVSGNANGTITIWDLLTGKELRTLVSHHIMGVAISGDNRTLVSGDETITIWDMLTGKELRTLVASHHEIALSVAISGDNRTLVSGGVGGIMTIWDMLTGKELQTLVGHKGIVWSIVISGDNKTLVSGSDDRMIKVWDMLTGEELRTLAGHQDAVLSVGISGDNKTLVSGSVDGTIKIWDMLTGKELRTLAGHQGRVSSVALSGDNRILVSGDETIKIWDMLTGKELRTLTAPTDIVTCVVISENGKTLISGSRDGAINIWKA